MYVLVQSYCPASEPFKHDYWPVTLGPNKWVLVEEVEDEIEGRLAPVPWESPGFREHEHRVECR